jgi:hypothetical protein
VGASACIVRSGPCGCALAAARGLRRQQHARLDGSVDEDPLPCALLTDLVEDHMDERRAGVRVALAQDLGRDLDPAASALDESDLLRPG